MHRIPSPLSAEWHSSPTSTGSRTTLSQGGKKVAIKHHAAVPSIVPAQQSPALGELQLLRRQGSGGAQDGGSILYAESLAQRLAGWPLAAEDVQNPLAQPVIRKRGGLHHPQTRGEVPQLRKLWRRVGVEG